MSILGYEHLRGRFKLSAFPIARPATVKSVTRIEQTENFLAIPRHVAPDSDNPVAHLLFALKHEGTNLQVLAELMCKIDPKDLLLEFRRAPTGAYIRVACFLWEKFTGKQFDDLPEIAGPTVDVFNSSRYITGQSRRDTKWRVAFNGLGSINYCATVERTPYITNAINSDILGRTHAFIEALGGGVMDRALTWAYLHETESTFAIERESPSDDKSRAFVALLHQAHERRLISENYLVDLQNSIVNNPHDQASSFRFDQNHLRGSMRGAAGVTYLPPPPGMLTEIMDELMSFINHPPKDVDPIVIASIASFGFVFIHPFSDGNGRLSRFLFHQSLCQSGKLKSGIILPVSVAMKNNEQEYLLTLQQYSRPVRDLWSVKWIDGDQYDNTFNGHPSVYKYWDATRCVEFGYKMASHALDVELKNETKFLIRYDKVLKEVDRHFNVQGSVLASLIMLCLDNNNVISNNRRKQFVYKVPSTIFDFIEECARKSNQEVETDDNVLSW